MPSFRRPQHDSLGLPRCAADLPESAVCFESAIEVLRSGRLDTIRLGGPVPDQGLYLAVIAWITGGRDEAASTDAVISLFRQLDRLGATPIAPGRVYNETIVMFWIAVAQRRLPRTASMTPDARAAAARVFARGYADRPHLIYEFYRQTLVHSWRARLGWVEPDLKSIDALNQNRGTDADDPEKAVRV